jgi:hypothetical protein
MSLNKYPAIPQDIEEAMDRGRMFLMLVGFSDDVRTTTIKRVPIVAPTMTPPIAPAILCSCLCFISFV